MSGFLDNTQINYVFEKEGREEGGQGGGRLSRPVLSPWAGHQPWHVQPAPPRPLHKGSVRGPGWGGKVEASSGKGSSSGGDRVGGNGGQGLSPRGRFKPPQLTGAGCVDPAASPPSPGTYLWASVSSCVRWAQAWVSPLPP